MNLDTPQLIAIAAALGWASGLRLYAVLFFVGMAGTLGWVDLPAGLRLLANGPQAVAASKRLVQDLAGQPITAELRADTARRIADIRASDEGREGVAAFLGKREPGWRG